MNTTAQVLPGNHANVSYSSFQRFRSTSRGREITQTCPIQIPAAWYGISGQCIYCIEQVYYIPGADRLQPRNERSEVYFIARIADLTIKGMTALPS